MIFLFLLVAIIAIIRGFAKSRRGKGIAMAQPIGNTTVNLMNNVVPNTHQTVDMSLEEMDKQMALIIKWKNEGSITKEEFEQKKNELLSRISKL